MEYRRPERRQFRRYAFSFKLIPSSPKRIFGGYALISILKSVDDLTRLEELEKREALSSVIRDCYSLAIHSAAHYAVEVDPRQAAELRQNLQQIEDQSRAAVSADQFRAAQSSFRGELREYRDKSSAQLVKLRKEVENATAAMTIFAETVSSNGENHEQEIAVQLRALEAAAKMDNIAAIRGGIGHVVGAIEASVQQIQRGNQLVVAQLQDEIRVLHLQIEQERKALFTDRASGAWNRQKIDIHLDNLLRQNQPFCLLLVSVRNLKRLDTQHSRTVVEGTLKALVTRFAAMLEDDAVIGRWTEDQFVAILDVPAGNAIPLSAEATRKLTGSYAVQENGLSQKVTVQATAGVIDRPAGANSATFLEKLEQLAGAISGK
jgi:GGDEF domain-containing protein